MDATELFGTGPQVLYSNTQEELLRACTQRSLQSSVVRRKARFGEFIILCLVGAGALRTLLDIYPPGIVFGSILLLIWTLAAVGGIALLRFTLRREMSFTQRILADQGLFDGQTGEHKMILTEQGVVEQNERGVVLIRWAYITGIESTPLHFRVLSGPGWFFLVPKSAFADEIAAQAFEATLRLKMQESKTLSPQT